MRVHGLVQYDMTMVGKLHVGTRVIPSQLGLVLWSLGLIDFDLPRPVSLTTRKWRKPQAGPGFINNKVCLWLCHNKCSPSLFPSCQSSIRSTFTESNSGLCTMVSPCGNQTLSRASTTRSRSATLVTYMKGHSFECST